MSQTNLVAHTYNPHNQNPQELIDGFVVRKKEFAAFYKDISTDRMNHPPQHEIIQGRRGSGKTSFLLRIYHEVNRDASVNKWLLPLIFNEEQYAVRTLYKLWERVADELENGHREFLGLTDAMEQNINDARYEEICFDLVVSALKKRKKKLLLLIDNFGDMLHKFTEREQRRLREILITCIDIRIIGASSVAMESTYEYDKPFFEFFRITNLDGLSKEETVTLLLALGERYGKPLIKEIVENNPGKIEALRRLTDGVPRTMILLFEIFVDDAAGDSFRDLDMVLDRVTPLYKHRMDDLSAQQQELVDIIALAWDAVGVKEIAQRARMESKAVSAQLRMLEKNRIIVKKQTSTKNHLYQVSERFFNIWYLMRYGRKKDKQQVHWLTRFLEEWCSNEELMERAKSHLTALRSGTLCEPCAYYMTKALAKAPITYEMQDSLIKEARSFLQQKGSALCGELGESDMELFEKAKRHYDRKEYDSAIRALDSIQLKSATVLALIGFCHHKMHHTDEAEKYYRMAMEKGDVDAMNNLAVLYETEKKDIDNADKYYRMASEKGDVDAMLNLALLYHMEKHDIDKAEKYYKMAIEKGNRKACFNIALLYYEQQKNKKAALEYITKVKEPAVDAGFQLAYPIILLWNDDVENSTSIAQPLFSDQAILQKELFIQEYLLLLIAKHQYTFTLRLFNESPLDLRRRYRPIYYALMYFMQDKYPDEFKKMGSELEQTVMEIVQKIKKMEKTM